jgi:hypothetical protein
LVIKALDPDPDPYWSPTSYSGSGSGKNEYGSTTLIHIHIPNKKNFEKLSFLSFHKLTVEVLKMVPFEYFYFCSSEISLVSYTCPADPP